MHSLTALSVFEVLANFELAFRRNCLIYLVFASPRAVMRLFNRASLIFACMILISVQGRLFWRSVCWRYRAAFLEWITIFTVLAWLGNFDIIWGLIHWILFLLWECLLLFERSQKLFLIVFYKIFSSVCMRIVALLIKNFFIFDHLLVIPINLILLEVRGLVELGYLASLSQISIHNLTPFDG